MVKRILITGAAGFVGSHVIEHFLLKTDWEIVGLCRVSTIGDVHRILDNPKIKEANDNGRIELVYGDTKFGISESLSHRIGHVDYILHLAANSHVDRSITNPLDFVFDNVLGTAQLLDWARKSGNFDMVNGRFINAGTDEVFGPVLDHLFKEDEAHKPSNPYAASKASQLDWGYAYFVTYKMPVINTHMMNIFGERQAPEKLIPKAMKAILDDKPMTIHCRKNERGDVTEIGERCWLHARNAADAYLFLFEHGVPGEYYNITGDAEMDNLSIVQLVAKYLGKEKDLKIDYVDFHKARPGHDRKYGLDGTKIKELGWIPPVKFDEALKHVVEWTMAHREWLK